MNKLKARIVASLDATRPGVAEFLIALTMGMVIAGAAIGNVR